MHERHLQKPDPAAAEAGGARLCEKIDGKVKAFFERPYLWIDATYLKVRRGGRVASVADIIATGVNSDGRREVFLTMGLDAPPDFIELLPGLSRQLAGFWRRLKVRRQARARKAWGAPSSGP